MANNHKGQSTYSRRNPPANEKAALNRMEELDTEIAGIEIQLEQTVKEDFETDEGYYSWEKRAKSALKFKRVELNFLREWADGPGTTDQQSLRSRNMRVIAEDIRTTARRLAEDIEQGYFSNTASNLTEKLRLAKSTKRRIQEAFGEITAQWNSHPLRRDGLVSAKLPLQQVLSKIEEKIGSLKQRIRTVEQDLTEVDWKTVCANALSRAVAAGFILTPLETSVLEKLRKL